MTPAFNYNLNLEREDEEEEKEGIYAREGLHRPEPLVESFESLSSRNIFKRCSWVSKSITFCKYLT